MTETSSMLPSSMKRGETATAGSVEVEAEAEAEAEATMISKTLSDCAPRRGGVGMSEAVYASVLYRRGFVKKNDVRQGTQEERRSIYRWRN